MNPETNLTPLYIDSLSFTNKIFDKSFNLRCARLEAETFLQAAKKSNFRMQVFIDADIQTEESPLL